MVKLQGIPCSLVLTFRILGLNSFDRAFFLPVWCPAGFSWFPAPTTLNKATLVFNAYPCSTLYTLVVLFLFEEPNPMQVTRVVQLGASNPGNRSFPVVSLLPHGRPSVRARHSAAAGGSCRGPRWRARSICCRGSTPRCGSPCAACSRSGRSLRDFCGTLGPKIRRRQG